MIAMEEIRDPEVAAFAREASDFMRSQSWCRSVVSVHLAWAVAGVLGVFLVRLVPARADIDDTLWVVVGDVPSAYLVCDGAPSWREALENYVIEMRRWVVGVRRGESLADGIPVDVSPTLEHADLLDSRLRFITERILDDEAGEIAGDV